jgi:hypothetical protein
MLPGSNKSLAGFECEELDGYRYRETGVGVVFYYPKFPIFDPCSLEIFICYDRDTEIRDGMVARRVAWARTSRVLPDFAQMRR